MRSGSQWKKNGSVLPTRCSSAIMWVLLVDLDVIKQWDLPNPCCWLLCGFGLTNLVVMDWEIGEGHIDVNEVWESVKEKCECLAHQLLFCNCVSVVGWSGCDQTMRLTESLLSHLCASWDKWFFLEHVTKSWLPAVCTASWMLTVLCAGIPWSAFWVMCIVSPTLPSRVLKEDSK